MAALVGVQVMKVMPPTDHIEAEDAKKVYEKAGVNTPSLTERVKHVVQRANAGRRIVIFSGGEAKGDEAVLSEIKELAAGGAFGSIVGRNSFQRPKPQAIKLLETIQGIYKEAH